jgi:hypothetical protein
MGNQPFNHPFTFMRGINIRGRKEVRLLLSLKKSTVTAVYAQLYVLTPLPLFQRKLNKTPTAYALLRRKR